MWTDRNTQASTDEMLGFNPTPISATLDPAVMNLYSIMKLIQVRGRRCCRARPQLQYVAGKHPAGDWRDSRSLVQPVMESKMSFSYRWITNFMQASVWSEWGQRDREPNMTLSAWKLLVRQIQWTSNTDHGWGVETPSPDITNDYLRNRQFTNKLRASLATNAVAGVRFLPTHRWHHPPSLGIPQCAC